MPRRSRNNGTDRYFANSHLITGSTTTRVAADYTRRPQNFNIVQTPPRNMSNQIYWAQLSYDTQFNVSGTVVSENNFYFRLADFTSASSLATVFDQYCIYGVTMSFSLVNAVNPILRLYTALDYDSASAIGLSALQGYSSYEQCMLSTSTSHLRFVKPCLAPTISSTTPTDQSALVSRQWLDSNYTSIPHYGIRSIVGIAGVSSTQALEVSVTAICGFRNNI